MSNISRGCVQAAIPETIAQENSTTVPGIAECSLISTHFHISNNSDSKRPNLQRSKCSAKQGREWRLRVTLLTAWFILLAAVPASADYKSGVVAYECGEYETAFREFKRLAEKGNAKAQMMLATMYETGAGVRRDYAEAFKWYLYAARKGEVEAQFMLAQMYYEGRGGPKDYAEAIKWCTIAARGGHVYAQYNLGVFYEQGRLTTLNKAEACKWFLKAAHGKVPEAQFKVGLCYVNGDGTSLDLVQGYMWLDLAAANGSKAAAKTRDVIAVNMTSDQIQRGKELVRFRSTGKTVAK